MPVVVERWWRSAAIGLIAVMLLARLSTGSALAEVYADETTSTDPNKPQIMAMAKDLVLIPRIFGCAFAWGQVIGPHSMTLEFVPKSHDVRKWSKLFTITTFELPPKEDAQRALIARLQTLTVANFSERGTVTKKQLGEDRAKMPTVYFEYELGQGAAKEYGVAGIYKARPNLALIVQFQMRTPLAKTDTAKMSDLALPKP